MERWVLLLLTVFVATVSCDTEVPISYKANCGTWTPYKNEKCIHLVERAGTQTKQDAEVICQTLAESDSPENVPNLVTVKTKEKHDFLQELFFSKHATLENVWLGLEMQNDSVFRWNDGTELFFTNWAKRENSPDERRCVQMESGEGAYEVGKWVTSNCKKRNAVVCEKTQTWSVTTLQNILLTLKLEVDKNRQEGDELIKATKHEADDKIITVKKEAEERINANKLEADRMINEVAREANKKIEDIIKNPVPIGYIFIQLDQQASPRTLWPQATWTDISASYAGLFFRVVGGNAASFGQIQGESSPHLANVQTYRKLDSYPDVIGIPTNGQWSQYIFTGDSQGNEDVFLRFQMAAGEVRPRNKAVIVWKRTA